jgi:hypothetical protein
MAAAIGRTKRMRMNGTSVLVDDQAKALAFYTDVLGFERRPIFPSAKTAG